MRPLVLVLVVIFSTPNLAQESGGLCRIAIHVKHDSGKKQLLIERSDVSDYAHCRQAAKERRLDLETESRGLAKVNVHFGFLPRN